MALNRICQMQKNFFNSPRVGGALCAIVLAVIMGLVISILFQAPGADIGGFIAGVGLAIGTGVLALWGLYQSGLSIQDARKNKVSS